MSKDLEITQATRVRLDLWVVGVIMALIIALFNAYYNISNKSDANALEIVTVKLDLIEVSQEQVKQAKDNTFSFNKNAEKFQESVSVLTSAVIIATSKAENNEKILNKISEDMTWLIRQQKEGK